MEQQVTLRAVIFKSGTWWMGQCLEHDIAAQAKTLQDVPAALERAVVGHLVIATDNGLPALQNVPKAPARYWEMFNRGLTLAPSITREFVVGGLPVPLPSTELRISEPILEPA